MEEKNTFTVIGEDGKKIVLNVLFTFDSDETKKSYVVYTDITKDKTGNILPIETEKEWKVIETILDSLQEEIKNQTSGGNSSNN